MWGQPPSAVRRAKPGSLLPPNAASIKKPRPGKGRGFLVSFLILLLRRRLLLRAHRAKAFPV